MRIQLAILFFAGALVCPAQWELGGAIGYGVYRNGTIYAPGEKATAGIRNRFAAGIVLGEDMFEHLSGEVRYTYHDGHPFLSSGPVKTDIQGESHAVTYDLLFHFRPRRARVRPYLTGGIGGKWYVISGPSNPEQPLMRFARLTTQDETKAVFAPGGGVEIHLSRRLAVRADFLDYLTTFPKQMIRPTGANTARGIFEQFTALGGLSYRF